MRYCYICDYSLKVKIFSQLSAIGLFGSGIVALEIISVLYLYSIRQKQVSFLFDPSPQIIVAVLQSFSISASATLKFAFNLFSYVKKLNVCWIEICDKIFRLNIMH